LRVEELRALLSEQEDMQFLPPIADRDQALDVPSRTILVSRIHLVIIEWEFCEERHFYLLQVLSKHLRCFTFVQLHLAERRGGRRVPQMMIAALTAAFDLRQYRNRN